MTIQVSREIYNDICISKCVYAFSGKYSFRRTINGEIEEIEVMAHKDEDIPCDFEQIFFDTLNDYKLRCIIEEQTKDIRTLLYAKAFMNSDNEG
ncbi:MAG: His-Xaa-Ser system protein HxsD [Bacteroides heparinolyticus]|nr:His-Xaa-Ser system protein HxsD [Bacteroides heparinolyticus]